MTWAIVMVVFATMIAGTLSAIDVRAEEPGLDGLTAHLRRGQVHGFTRKPRVPQGAKRGFVSTGT
jgi:hypothetical protein